MKHIVLAALLVTGCVTNVYGPSPTPSESGAAVTPATSAMASDMPTSAPPVDNSGWAEFLGWYIDISGELLAQTRRLEAASVSDYYLLGLDMAGTATRGMEWLNAHDPDPCFASLHTDVFLMLSSYGSAGLSMADGNFAAVPSQLQNVLDSLTAINESGMSEADAACSDGTNG